MSTEITSPLAIELRHVSKQFGGNHVLDDVSLAIPAKCGLCVLGRSGTGKSVMLKHIVGLITPDAGQVLVEGENIIEMSHRQLSRTRQRIGFLFQNAALFDSLTVGDNIAFPLRRHTGLPEAKIVARVRSLLAQVGLERDYETMPADLSGGMKKRAGLARAMALEPPILLVDEPSAGLDPVTAAEIDALLIDLRHRVGTTLVVVTHNIPSARAIGDELVFLHDGKILARGSPERLDRSEHPLVRDFMRSGATG